MKAVLVSGALANKPFNGGEAWVRLSWILGLRRLGFAVYFVEQIGRKGCIDAGGNPAADVESSANLAYFRRVTEQFGLAEVSALIDVETGRTFGMDEATLHDVAAAADLLVNISGHLTWEPVMSRVRCKAYIDIDPGFTQFWHADPTGGFRLGGHDFYFTIGENIGLPDCPIPTGGIRWQPVRQPVVLDDWMATPATDPNRFTTVASWRGAFGPVQAGGRTYGLKVHEFRKCLALPALAGAACEAAGLGQPRFEVALDIHPGDAKDLAALRANGWHVSDPRALAHDPEEFRTFVQSSGAEFSVAQGIYVDTNSGWFSDRTVRYLASGRPALVQETGFSRHVRSGTGLVPFTSAEEAAEGAARIMGDYANHARAAREIAAEFFDSDRVLRRFLADVGM